MIHRFGDCELDTQLYQLRRAGELVELEPKVFDLLIYLIQQHDRVVSKDELLDKVWPGQVVSETALTQCVMAARKAVGDDGTRQHTIKTQHGRGYRFIAALAAPVPSAEFRVPSQEEERQKAESAKDVEASVQRVELSSLDEAQRNPGEAESLPQMPLPSIPATELDLPAYAARFPWSRKGLVVTGLLLLVAIIVVVQYLSLPTLNPQPPTLTPQSLPLPDKPSIIVLPFVNLSGDPSQEYFSDGMTEEITSALSRLSSLFVIARTSAFTYKGKAAKVQDISREMGVRYVLEGSIQKADGQVRIIAQLIDAITGKHLWSERYDRPLQNIFALQDEIREKIALALQVQLAPGEPGRSQSVPTANLEAYDFYLRGREAFWRAFYKNDPMTPARQLFESALALDPQYAEAYAQIGGTYLADWFFEPSRNQGQSLKRAVAMGQRAIALDEALPLPHAILGTVYVWNKQHEQALVAAQRAVILDPNFADGYFHLGTVLYFVGQPNESIKAYEQAIRLDPKHPDLYLHHLAASYRLAGRYQEALALGQQFAASHPDYVPGHVLLALCYGDLEQLEDARAEGAEILRLNPAFNLTAFERLWPMKDPAIMERSLVALRKAGLK
jgi:TolB-like protein/DNA-binding winged helix-turn-helix (wHTH) protein